MPLTSYLHSEWTLITLVPEENPMSRLDSKINRREFLQKGSVVAAGGSTLGSTAPAASAVSGAYARNSLGPISIGRSCRGDHRTGGVRKDQRKWGRAAGCC